MTYEQASEFIENLTLVPTGLTAAQLAQLEELPPELRALAFMSAQVSSLSILTELQAAAAELAGGEIDLAAVRLKFKGMLAELGFEVDDAATGAGNWIDNLASTSRLNLILRTVTRQAHAKGKLAVSMDPDILARWPYFRYVSGLLDTSRPGHRELHGLILPKTHSFWATHVGPWDYNCTCSVEDATEEEAQAAGVGSVDGTSVTLPDGGEIDVPANESGYEWDATAEPGTIDWDSIPDSPIKALIKAEIEKKQAEMNDEA